VFQHAADNGAKITSYCLEYDQVMCCNLFIYGCSSWGFIVPLDTSVQRQLLLHSQCYSYMLTVIIVVKWKYRLEQCRVMYGGAVFLCTGSLVLRALWYLP